MLMIKNRLSAILGEQRMRVSELSKLSGISQNALNKIYHNKTKGIDFQTLDKLCEVLKCSTQDLFQYIEGWIQTFTLRLSRWHQNILAPCGILVEPLSFAKWVRLHAEWLRSEERGSRSFKLFFFIHSEQKITTSLRQNHYSSCKLRFLVMTWFIKTKRSGRYRLFCTIRDSETVLDYWRLDRLNAVLAKTCWVCYAHTAHLPKSAVRNDHSLHEFSNRLHYLIFFNEEMKLLCSISPSTFVKNIWQSFSSASIFGKCEIS